jgi:phosphate transport system substrate-binding protein
MSPTKMPTPPTPKPVSGRRPALLALLAAGSGLIVPRVYGQAADDVRIGGTGAGVAPVRALLEGTPGVRVVPNLGTGGGLMALNAGAIDIALSSRNITAAETQAGLVAQPLFRTPYVFAVHHAVRATGATIAELAGFFGGHPWPDGTPVRTVLRPDKDSDTDFVRSLGPAMSQALKAAQARPGTFVAVTDGDATEAMERIGGSLGVTTTAMLATESRRLRALALDGVQPSLEALARGRYPHAKTVYLVTRGAPAPAAQTLITMLGSRSMAPRWATLGCLPGQAG